MKKHKQGKCVKCGSKGRMTPKGRVRMPGDLNRSRRQWFCDACLNEPFQEQSAIDYMYNGNSSFGVDESSFTPVETGICCSELMKGIKESEKKNGSKSLLYRFGPQDLCGEVEE